MQKEYEKYIHHASTLIVNGKYKRAKAVIETILDQGFKNCEVYVLLSYAIKMQDGIGEAIRLLEKCSNTGPLIKMAIAQYYHELNSKRKCLERLQTIQHQSSNSKNRKQSTIVEIQQNMQALLSPEKEPLRYHENTYSGIDVEAVCILNAITTKYRNEQIGRQQARIEYQKLIDERMLNGKLRDYAEKFVIYLGR